MPPWGAEERSNALAAASGSPEPLDLLVIGGGITGAAVLRDAASRGLRALLVERDDFASGTSSRSSKMIHGGLRYVAEGQLRVTAESCRERDLLMAKHPNLVRRTPFLYPCFAGGRVPPWQIRTALSIYAALAGFRKTARFSILDAEASARLAPGLRREGLRTSGAYHDGQADDARLVLENLRHARSLGADAVNHTEVTALLHEQGRAVGVVVRDRLADRTLSLRAHVLVNAAGPGIERIRGLDRTLPSPELRPAKGVHLVVRAERIPIAGTVSFDADDGRHLFVAPWDDMALIGTTDDFTDEIDEPVVTIEEVHYLLAATNAAFPGAALTTNDLVSTFAGVRPLVAPRDASVPPSSVSREHQIYEDASGLVSAAGGKLTTHRAMGESLVDRALRRLPPERRQVAGPSRTRELALRDDAFDGAALAKRLHEEFALGALPAQHLVRQYGRDARSVLETAPAGLRRRIGVSRFVWAEIPWAMRHDCALTLCDLLEHRVRLALFAAGQGLPDLPAIAALAGEAAGWSPERVEREAATYRDTVRRRYQIAATPPQRASAA